MFRLLERYQTFIVVLATMLFPLLVYRAHATSPGDANLVDRVVLAATTPIKKVLADAVGGVSHAWYEYVDVVGARRENGELRRRLFFAERERDDLRALEVENEHLRGLLLIRDRNPSLSPLAATVISAGSSPLSRTIDIDVGAIRGVERGMAVVADEGLVGLVMRVGWTSSEVMLVADEKMTLWGRVVRSRARCRVRGAGLGPSFGVELTEVLRSDDVRIGDRIATSGLGGVFPAGIPIGEVKGVRTPTGAQHRVADLEPYVDFARLEHVSVLLGTAKREEPIVTPEPLRPATLRVSHEGDEAAAPLAATSDVGDAGLLLDPGSLQDGGLSRDAGLAGRPSGGPSHDGGLAGKPSGGPPHDGGRSHDGGLAGKPSAGPPHDGGRSRDGGLPGTPAAPPRDAGPAPNLEVQPKPASGGPASTTGEPARATGPTEGQVPPSEPQESRASGPTDGD